MLGLRKDSRRLEKERHVKNLLRACVRSYGLSRNEEEASDRDEVEPTFV